MIKLAKDITSDRRCTGCMAGKYDKDYDASGEDGKKKGKKDRGGSGKRSSDVQAGGSGGDKGKGK